MTRRSACFPRALAVVVLGLAAFAAPPPLAAQEDPAAALSTLVKGHVYDGVTYRKETIRRVQVSPQGLLALEFDDAQESSPVTAIVPLREIAEVKTSQSVVGSQPIIVLNCQKPACIATTTQSISSAIAKLAQDPAAQLTRLKRRDSLEFGCKMENCRPILRALGGLVRTAKSG